jgi:hypothetical protein
MYLPMNETLLNQDCKNTEIHYRDNHNIHSCLESIQKIEIDGLQLNLQECSFDKLTKKLLEEITKTYILCFF